MSISQLGGYAAMRHALIFCNYTDATRVFSCVFNLIRISWRIGVGDATVECSFAKIRYHSFTEKDLLKMLLYHPLSVYHFFVNLPVPRGVGGTVQQERHTILGGESIAGPLRSSMFSSHKNAM